MSNSSEGIIGAGFHHIALRVRDFDASVKFYTEVLGFQKKGGWVSQKSGLRIAMLDSGDGCCIEMFEGGKGVFDPNGMIPHIALRTGDCDAAIARVRAAGAEITTEPFDLTVGSTPPNTMRIGFFKGPDGELLEFFQSKGWL